MYFITNRKLNINKNSLIPRVVEFDLSNNASNNEIYFCNRKKKNLYEEIGHINFLNNLSGSNYDQILLYIHGYNNLPEDSIFQNTEKLQNYFKKKTNNSILVIPIIWPCDNDLGIIKDYWDDQISADMSSFSIKRILNFFHGWCNDNCHKHINVLAHSMGNRVLRESLIAWEKYDMHQGIPRIFRNVFLIAADLVNKTLEIDEPGSVICDSARNVVVYYANDDLALRSSKIINLKHNIASRRLGHTGPEQFENVPKNVYSVDCDEINNIYDFSKGHSYFIPKNEYKDNSVLDHIYYMLDTGRFDQNSEIRSLILNKLD